MHALRPAYLEELHTGADTFTGERVLEVGCGPLAPVLQFAGCERHGIDPFAGQYLEIGWPLYAAGDRHLRTESESTDTQRMTAVIPFIRFRPVIARVNALLPGWPLPSR
jgi:hypothetical protein